MLDNNKVLKKKEHPFQLMIYGNGKSLGSFPLSTGKFIIGSKEDCAICLNHSSVSKNHASFLLDSKGGKIVDLNSKNGVYINGKKVIEGRFSFGDFLQVGVVKLVLLESEKPDTKEKVDTLPKVSVTGSAQEISPYLLREQLGKIRIPSPLLVII